jgi:hypothetical protein
MIFSERERFSRSLKEKEITAEAASAERRTT